MFGVSRPLLDVEEGVLPPDCKVGVMLPSVAGETLGEVPREQPLEGSSGSSGG